MTAIESNLVSSRSAEKMPPDAIILIKKQSMFCVELMAASFANCNPQSIHPVFLQISSF
ncbi:hypothetical protein TSMEX_005052 [Taenia solium]|eukprot:TsM_000434700 transcript=TsM_000434700 gene=TsM_000434700